MNLDEKLERQKGIWITRGERREKARNLLDLFVEASGSLIHDSNTDTLRTWHSGCTWIHGWARAGIFHVEYHGEWYFLREARLHGIYMVWEQPLPRERLTDSSAYRNISRLCRFPNIFWQVDISTVAFLALFLGFQFLTSNTNKRDWKLWRQLPLRQKRSSAYCYHIVPHESV